MYVSLASLEVFLSRPTFINNNINKACICYHTRDISPLHRKLMGKFSASKWSIYYKLNRMTCSVARFVSEYNNEIEYTYEEYLIDATEYNLETDSRLNL